MQSQNLKSIFDSGNKDQAETQRAHLELNFKTLMQQCKSKLNEIAPLLASNLESKSSADKVTANVTQSVLIKMQELSASYNQYKARSRNIGKYDAKC